MFDNYYASRYNTDEWRKLRLKILDKRGRICQLCGSINELNVHHITYKNFRHEKEDELVVLCKRCHNDTHYKNPNNGVKEVMSYCFGGKNAKKVY